MKKPAASAAPLRRKFRRAFFDPGCIRVEWLIGEYPQS